MSLILTESFDAYAVGQPYSCFSGLSTKHGRYVTGLSGLQGGYTIGGSAQNNPTGRHGNCLWIYGMTDSGRSNSLESLIPEGSEADTVIVGFALNLQNGNGASGTLLSFGERRSTGTVDHVTLNVAGINTGVVTVQRGAAGGTTLGTFTVPRLSWCYLEVKVKVHDTAGTVDVRVDGVSVLSLSGIDTRNAGTGLISRVLTAAGVTFSNPSHWYIDDWYLLTVDGVAPFSDFLGDVTIEYLQPNGADTTNWSVTGAATNWDAVAEPVSTVAPQVSDYVSSSTTDQLDLYTLADSAATAASAIVAVASYAYADKADTGARSLALVHDVSGAQVASSDLTLKDAGAGGPQYQRWLRTLSPDGSPWTVAKVNSLKVGMKARP